MEIHEDFSPLHRLSPSSFAPRTYLSLLSSPPFLILNPDATKALEQEISVHAPADVGEKPGKCGSLSKE